MLNTHLIDHHLQEQVSRLLQATIYSCHVIFRSSLCHEVMAGSQQTEGFVQLVAMVKALLQTAETRTIETI